MPRLSVCIEMIFREVDFLDRIPKVKAAGFEAFEFWGTSNKDLAAVKRLKDQHGLTLTAVVTEYKQPLSEPANHASFVEGFKRAAQVANDLECKAVIVTVGNETPAPRRRQHDNIVAGLKAAAPIAEERGVTMVLEPLNVLVDHKGYYLAASAEGFEMVREVASPNVKLLYDIYHQQITEGNLIATITANLAHIGHFHSADVPGRHEFGTGEINYPNVLRAIDSMGYTGYVGLEFGPTGASEAALARVREIAGV